MATVAPLIEVKTCLEDRDNPNTEHSLFDPKIDDNILPTRGENGLDYLGVPPTSNWLQQLRVANGPALISLIPPEASVNWQGRVRTLRIPLTLFKRLDTTDDSFTEFSTNISIEDIRQLLSHCHSEKCTRRSGVKHQIAVHSITLLQPSLKNTIRPTLPWRLSLKSPEHTVPLYMPDGPPSKVVEREWFIDYPAFARHDMETGRLYATKGLTVSSMNEVLGRAPSITAYTAHGINLRALEYWNLLLHDYPKCLMRLTADIGNVYVKQAPTELGLPCQNMLTYAMTRRGRKTIGNNYTSHMIDKVPYHAWPDAKFREHLTAIAVDLFERPYIQSAAHRFHPLLGTVDNSNLKLTATPVDLPRWLRETQHRKTLLGDKAKFVNSFELDTVLEIVAVVI
jgi:hypothetical protein